MYGDSFSPVIHSCGMRMTNCCTHRAPGRRPHSLVPVVALMLSLHPTVMAAPTGRPFQWNRELRRGALLSEVGFPATFRAPVDMVYRVWKESGGWRMEARSYGEESLVISMAILVNRKRATMEALRSELILECADEPHFLSELPHMELECHLNGGDPARAMRLRLEPLAVDVKPGDAAGASRLLLVMAVALADRRELLRSLDVRQQPGSPGDRPP